MVKIMDLIVFNEQNVLEYIEKIINDTKKNSIDIEDAKYHHNSSYMNGLSILKNGILSLVELDRLGIRKMSYQTLNVMGDIESHINGNDGISLSVVGLTDLYRDEFEYDPFQESLVDFLISNDIKVYRRSIHYGNEYIANKCIEVNKIKSIDIRLLKYLNNIDSKEKIDALIQKYNSLIEMSARIKNCGLNITIREMSDENNISLDIDKLYELPRLVLRR